MVAPAQDAKRARSKGATTLRPGLKAAKAVLFISLAAFGWEASSSVAVAALPAEATDVEQFEKAKNLEGDAVQASKKINKNNGQIPRLRLRTAVGTGADDEDVENNKNEGTIPSKEHMLGRVKDGFTPRFPLVSSDEELTTDDHSACATVEYNGEWNDDNRVQPDATSGYTCKGLGDCLDSYGHSYSSVNFNPIQSQKACGEKCSSIQSKEEFLRGFEYRPDPCNAEGGTCGCLYDKGNVPHGVTGASTTSDWLDGTGEVTSTNGYEWAVCFAYQQPDHSQPTCHDSSGWMDTAGDNCTWYESITDEAKRRAVCDVMSDPEHSTDIAITPANDACCACKITCQNLPDWNANFGTCDTYDPNHHLINGALNYNFCNSDFSQGYYAYQVCEECGKCETD